MGLTWDFLEFDGAPPTEAELVEALRTQAGNAEGLEHYGVDGRRVELRCLLEPVTRPYALKFLAGRGAVLVDRQGGAARPTSWPPYADRPWRSHPWWRRAWIRLAYRIEL